MELEKSGQLYEAIEFYRKAVQLVPDIEFRSDIKVNKQKDSQDSLDSESDREIQEESEDEEDENAELLQRIQKKLGKLSTICVPKHEQRVQHNSNLLSLKDSFSDLSHLSVAN